MSNDVCKIHTPTPPRLFLSGSFDRKGYYVDMAACPITTSVAKPVSLPAPSGPSLVPVQFASEPTAMLGGTVDVQPLPIWHMRLGHLNERTIR